MAIGTGIVRIAGRLDRLIADDAIEDANFALDAGADRNRDLEQHISLADGEVGTGAGLMREALRAEGVGVGSGPQVNAIAGRPLLLIQRLLNSELDHVQIKAVRLAGAAELVIRQASVPRADVPLG